MRGNNLTSCLVYLPIVFLLLITLCSVNAQDDWTTIANQANEVYRSGDVTTAIELYESLIAAGVQDSTVYFNLGNAYYAIENFGGAVLNYRRAQRLDPRDADLSTNLSLARARRIDVQGDEAFLVDGLSALTASILTAIELSWLALMVWTIFFILLIVAITRPPWREGLRVPLVITGLLTLGAAVLLASRLYVDAARPAAVAMQEVVEVMSGPGDNYLMLDELHGGAEMRLLERQDEWVRFVLPDGRQGWSRSDEVEIV
jgi:tetratricopeptide (TPR) repeat protein